MADITKRISADGTTSYRVRIRLRGSPTQTATFHSLTKAKLWIQTTEAAIREGRHFKNTAARKHTVAELIDRYTQDVLPTKPKSLDKQTAQLTWWRSEIGHLLLSDLSPSVIAGCRDKLLAGTTYRGTKRSPATVVRYLAAFSHALSIAHREWEWLDHHPLQKVSRPKEPRGRVRFLNDDERERLIKACQVSGSPFLYPIVVLALSTGMRQGEILGLCWKDIDLQNGRILLHETKNGERRLVPLAGLALDLLVQLARAKHEPLDFAFPSADGMQPIAIRSAWDRTVKRAQLADFRFHDLRHSAASYLAMNQATPSEIAEVLGHKTLQMVKRYAHLGEAHTSALVTRMNDGLFKPGPLAPTAKEHDHGPENDPT